jgi:hypothetical protein
MTYIYRAFKSLASILLLFSLLYGNAFLAEANTRSETAQEKVTSNQVHVDDIVVRHVSDANTQASLVFIGNQIKKSFHDTEMGKF